jgi:hypothetical protein
MVGAEWWVLCSGKNGRREEETRRRGDGAATENAPVRRDLFLFLFLFIIIFI